MLRSFIFLLIAGGLFACKSTPNSTSGKDYHPLILISVDGYRFDYTEKFQAPNIQKFAEEGVKAEALIPCYPSKTFPNHWAVATGTYPGHNGLIHNAFFSKNYQATFKLGDAAERNNPRWYGGTPIWKLAEDQGKIAACYFWPGSEVEHAGHLPTYYYPYRESTPFNDRVDQVLKWAQLPEGERPDFITLYFHEPDHSGHHFGPDSKKTKQAMAEVDRALGRLFRLMNEKGIAPDYLLISDHGMVEVTHGIDYQELADFNGCQVLNAGGTQLMIYPAAETNIAGLIKALEANADGRYRVIQKKDAPEYWHYTHQDVPDFWLEANPHYMFVEAGRKPSAGTHGYDPAVQDTHAIFYANGPSFKRGMTIPAFENVNIYPLMARVLNLSIPQGIDGNLSVLQPILEETQKKATTE